jgi:hypothetical protein
MFFSFSTRGIGVARRGGEAALAAAAWGVVTLLALASIWTLDYLPTHDGPQHVFGVHAASRLDDLATGWGRFLEPGLPLTSHGFALAFGPFDRVLPWRSALRVALSLLVLTWCAGALALARAVHPERAWLGVVLAAGAFQWSLYMGLFSFHLATGFGLLVLAAALAAPRPSPGRRALLAGLLLVQALLHVFPAVLTGFALAVLALSRARPRRRLRALADVAWLGAPAACVALGMVWVGLAPLERANAGTALDWQAQRPALWTLARCFFAGPGWRAWPPTLLAAAAPLAALAASRRGGPGAADRALLTAGTLLLLTGLAAPLHLRAWDFFSVRFVPTAVACLLVALPFERLPAGGARRAAGAALGLFALAASGWAYAYNRDLAARAADALAALDLPLHRDGPRLPVVLDPYLGRPLDDAQALVPYAVPLLNLGQLYATAQGGLTPYTFALSWQMHPVVMRKEEQQRFPQQVDRKYAAELARPGRQHDTELRRAIVVYLGAMGSHYQDVILWGRPEDARVLLELGYEADFQRGGLLLARFRGCPLTLTFPPEALPPRGTRIELGWLPAWHVTHRYRIDPRRREADGSLTLPLETPPCGGVWLRLASEAGAADALECAGADVQGRLLIPSTRATPVVECRPASRPEEG